MYKTRSGTQATSNKVQEFNGEYMRDVFILENMAACKDLISDHLQKGYSEEDLLGVGAFSSSLPKNSPEGFQIKAIPSFLEQDLTDYIIKGHISAFEQESILIQPQFKNAYISISKWLIFGQHLSIFSLPEADISKYINFENIHSVEEFINNYFNQLISKINEMRAQIAFILLDIELFQNYILKFFNWIDKERTPPIKHSLKFGKPLEALIIKEILYFLSNAFFNHKIVIIPSSQMAFQILVNTSHEIKKELNTYSKEVTFRL